MDKARTSAEPVRLSANLNLHAPFFDARNKRRRGDRRMGGRAMKVDRENVGKAGTSGTVFSLSHIGLLSLRRCPE